MAVKFLYKGEVILYQIVSPHGCSPYVVRFLIHTEEGLLAC